MRSVFPEIITPYGRHLVPIMLPNTSISYSFVQLNAFSEGTRPVAMHLFAVAFKEKLIYKRDNTARDQVWYHVEFSTFNVHLAHNIIKS